MTWFLQFQDPEIEIIVQIAGFRSYLDLLLSANLIGQIVLFKGDPVQQI
jgi:hypothetical protein